MLTGILFDLREFTVHDGPGIRTTVFLKGCPLRCAWCHNPEGRSRLPQVMCTPVSSRVVGQEYTSAELARRLNAQTEILRLNEGGVTFSGGEPLLQAVFVAEVIDQLEGLHVLLDTSGYGSRQAFLSLVRRASLVYFDLKLMDPALFRQFAGRDNGSILRNLRLLSETGVSYVIRVPLVPGVTDSRANLSQIAAFLRGLPGLVQVDLLPYNRLAGAKYAALGMEFAPGYDEDRPLAPAGDIFEEAGLPWRLA